MLCLLLRAKHAEEYCKNFALVRAFFCIFFLSILFNVPIQLTACVILLSILKVDVIQARPSAALQTISAHPIVPTAPPESPTSIHNLPEQWSELFDPQSGRP
jgi:hypothetical protein